MKRVNAIGCEDGEYFLSKRGFITEFKRWYRMEYDLQKMPSNWQDIPEVMREYRAFRDGMLKALHEINHEVPYVD